MTNDELQKMCEFFIPQIQEFKFRLSVTLVPEEPHPYIGHVGGKLTKILHIPKICNPTLLSSYETMKLATAVLNAPNGINALGFVIHSYTRITHSDAKTITQLLGFAKMIPYTFIIFLFEEKISAETDNEQKRIIKQMLSDDRCPIILTSLLEQVNYRYMVLDITCRQHMVENFADYHSSKTYELMQLVESIIVTENRKPLTSLITDVAKSIQKSNLNLKKGIIAVQHDLKVLQDCLQEKKQKDGESAQYFWQTFSNWITTCMGVNKSAPLGEFSSLLTLGESATADLFNDSEMFVSDACASKHVGRRVENELCIIQ